jgi:hypothetical protein
MNSYQIIKLAAYQANAVKQSGVLDPFFTEAELMTWLNDANLELEKTLRSVFDDYFVRVMNSSTDTTAQKIMGIDYTPSTSLAIPASTSIITLPPDLETLRYIRCVTPGYEFFEFEHKDMGDRTFQEYLRVPSTYNVPPGGKLYYDIYGERTLLIAPQITSAVDIEIRYVARTHKLTNYSTGTIAVTTATTAVTGTSTVWSTGTALDPAYTDLIYTNYTFDLIDPSWQDDGINVNRVASITTDTALVLASNKVGTLPGGTHYALSSIPAMPPEHHYGLADFVTAQMFGKAGNQAQYDRYYNKWELRKKTILSTISNRQPDMEFVEEYEA